ncbi:MAG: ABC-F family ATP-binding cassette domain-containing protein [Thermomicrobiales bacterium]|nr:ABC-F family ATP-binding cassette domain-containing protein [Thermomicrobiales bacterium]
MPPATVLTATDLSKSFGPDEIFRGVSFQIADREHVALVGINGAGKSTLLKIIAGTDHANSGEVAIARGARMAVLQQDPRFDVDRSVRDEARLAFEDALAAQERMRALELAMQSAEGEELDEYFAEYERLSLHFEVAGGYDIEHRTDDVLTGLGFTPEQMQQSVHTLSGGQRTRVALAKALLSEPDLLLLDEPTNHLDLGMLEWLEGFLVTWRGAFLVVSHDRYFLDKVTNRTLDLSFGRLEDYPAAYARYLVLREERFERRLQEYEEQQAFIARTEEFIRRYKAGQRSREARGRQTRLDRLERIERPELHSALKLSTSPTIRSGREVVTTTPLRVGYKTSDGDIALLTTPELRVERGDRVAIIGDNGSGKSTLLKTIVGELPALKGRVGFGTNVKVGYYAQGHESLPPDGTPMSILLDAQPMGEESARAYLARFLFSGDDVDRSIGLLSGGERSRLALARLLVEGTNLLILDEPTNHLDIQSRETLEEMLAGFDGTVVFVSHDRFFVDRVATRVWEVSGGKLQTYLGNYTDAQRQKARLKDTDSRSLSKPVEAKRPEPAIIAAPPATKRTGAESTTRLQRKLESIEREIGKLEGTLNELSDAIAIAGLGTDHARLTKLSEDYAVAQAALDTAYAQWEEVNTTLAEANLVATP